MYSLFINNPPGEIMDKLITFCITLIVLVAIIISINNVLSVKESDKIQGAQVILEGIY